MGGIWTISGSNPRQDGGFFTSTNRPHQLWDPRNLLTGFLPGGKWTGALSLPLTSPSAKVKNTWSYTSDPSLYMPSRRGNVNSTLTLHTNFARNTVCQRLRVAEAASTMLTQTQSATLNMLQALT